MTHDQPKDVFEHGPHDGEVPFRIYNKATGRNVAYSHTESEASRIALCLSACADMESVILGAWRVSGKTVKATLIAATPTDK